MGAPRQTRMRLTWAATLAVLLAVPIQASGAGLPGVTGASPTASVSLESPLSLSDLPEGDHRLTVVAIDGSDNASAPTVVDWTEDYTAPQNRTMVMSQGSLGIDWALRPPVALFAQTDLIRARLADLGVTLEDRPGGTTWRVG